MEILFAEPSLKEAILLDRDYPDMPASIRARARYMLRLLHAMPDMRSLKNWKSARFRPAEGRENTCHVGLEGRHSLIVEIDQTFSPPAMTIIELHLEPREATGKPAHDAA